MPYVSGALELGHTTKALNVRETSPDEEMFSMILKCVLKGFMRTSHKRTDSVRQMFPHLA